MENTKENKEKFFAQYWGQQLLCWEGQTSSHKGMIVSRNVKAEIGIYFLELKRLEDISDEDAIEVIKRSGYVNFNYIEINSVGFWINYTNSKRKFVYFYELDSDSIDYVREKGYAYKFNKLSVEKQIEYNWIKLK